jgi:hypothetical protein
LTKQLRTTTDPSVAALLDGADPAARVGLVVELVTARGDGRPGVALLSVGEVLVTGPAQWRLALHAGSETSRVLRQPGATALASVVADGAHHGHHLRVRATWPMRIAGQELLGLVTDVTDVVVDTVGYARLEAGLTYRLTGPEEPVVRRWTETISALRRGADG